MSNWLDAAENGAFLKSLYGGSPALDPVELHDIRLDRDGPQANVRFDLPEFPSRLPKGWDRAGYNVVQLEILLIGLRSVQIDGWRTTMMGAMRIEPGRMWTVAFSNSDMTINLTGEFFRVHAARPYCRS